MTPRILVFSKAPEPGRAKTRLAPALGADGAARLHAALIRHTLATATGANIPVELWCDPGRHPFFVTCADEYGITLREQRGAGLGERMEQAVCAVQESGPAILIGTDCPALTTADLVHASGWLASGADAVLGPALDGGYYLLGLRRSDPALFHDIAWGTETVLAVTRERLGALGWPWRELPPRRDIDRPADLAYLPASLNPNESRLP